MPKNLSIYLKDDELAWLDSVCKEWKMSRGRAIQYVLRQSYEITILLSGLMKGKNPELAENLDKIINEGKK